MDAVGFMLFSICVIAVGMLLINFARRDKLPEEVDFDKSLTAVKQNIAIVEMPRLLGVAMQEVDKCLKMARLSEIRGALIMIAAYTDGILADTRSTPSQRIAAFGALRSMIKEIEVPYTQTSIEWLDSIGTKVFIAGVILEVVGIAMVLVSFAIKLIAAAAR